MTNQVTPTPNLNPVVRHGHVYVDSRQVAASFMKHHKNVLRTIEKLISIEPKLHGLNFEPMVIKTPIGSGATRNDKAYYVDRDGFALLVMGFTGRTSLVWKLRYIEAFNAMERELSARKQVSSYDIEAINAIADSRALLRVASIALQSPQWHDEQAIKDIGMVVDMANNGLDRPENVLNEI